MILAILLFWSVVGVVWLIVAMLRVVFVAALWILTLIGCVVLAIYDAWQDRDEPTDPSEQPTEVRYL